MENITQRLFLQTASRTFGDLTQREIYEKHIKEEKRKMWQEFKSLVIDDTLKKYSITPGLGKYEMTNKNSGFKKFE